jgi:hypothetical protein
MTTRYRVRALAVVAALALAAGCAKPSPPIDPSVSNEALGIRLASVPSDFEVSLNEADKLELIPADSSIEGRLWFEVGPVETGVNLVAAVKGHQRSIEEFPEADYKGGQELVTPLGSAYYSRGQFLLGLTRSEETVVLALHPSEERLLTVAYRYPAGVDSSVRVQQLLDVVGEIEAINQETSR